MRDLVAFIGTGEKSTQLIAEDLASVGAAEKDEYMKIFTEVKVKTDQVNRKQFLLQYKLRSVVFSELHVKMSHLGNERTAQLVRERFY